MFYDDDGGLWVDMNSAYYGELEYQLTYKHYNSNLFHGYLLILTDYEILQLNLVGL